MTRLHVYHEMFVKMSGKIPNIFSCRHTCEMSATTEKETDLKVRDCNFLHEAYCWGELINILKFKVPMKRNLKYSIHHNCSIC